MPTAWVRGRFWATVPVSAQRRRGGDRGGERRAAVAPLGRIEVGRPLPRSEPRPAGARGADRDLHGDVRARPGAVPRRRSSRCARRPTSAGSASSPTTPRGPSTSSRSAPCSGDDPRFVLSRSEERLGFYRNFERALRAGARPRPSCSRSATRTTAGGRRSSRSCARRSAARGSSTPTSASSTPTGRVLRDTLWHGRRNNHTDLTSMLVANTITGAAVLMRRDVAELALPFPDTPGMLFHDAWLAVVALAAGDVAYVDRPLYDYVQHRGAVFGSVTHGERPPPALQRPRQLLPRLPAARRARRGAARPLRRAHRAGQAPRARALRRRRALARRASRGWRRARCACSRAARRRSGARASCCPGCSGGGSPGRLRLDASLPELLSFEQKRLRRWRARV